MSAYQPNAAVVLHHQSDVVGIGVMKTFYLRPLLGVGEISLGMPRSEVLRILGRSVSFKKTPRSIHVTDAWYQNGFQVFYCGAEPVVEYIELSGKSGFEAILFGHPVFSTEASKLVALIDKHSPYDRNNPELGSSYIFPALEVSLWRPDEDDQCFRTVGVGVLGYYSE
jgi:hypothetical protein